MALYNIVDLGAFEPRAMNRFGSIAVAEVYPGQRRCRWHNGILTDLPSLPDSNNVPSAEVFDINDKGVIVGSTGDSKACLWDANNALEVLNLPDDPVGLNGTRPRSAAYGINNQGAICGVWQSYDEYVNSWGRAFKLVNGQFELLPLLGPDTGPSGGAAIAITNNNDVFGNSTWEPSGAVKWTQGTPDGTLLPSLPYGPPGSWTAATTHTLSALADANNSDFAVGSFVLYIGTVMSNGYNLYLPAFWSSDSWGILPSPGSIAYGAAMDVNESGQIVGWASYDGWAGQQATIWNGSIVTRLGDLISSSQEWHLDNATCMNDVGQIAGTGVLNGARRGWLMTPATVDHKLIPPTFLQILAGVRNDAPGVLRLPNGHIVPVGPGNPLGGILDQLIGGLPSHLQSMLRAALEASTSTSRRVGEA